MSALTVILAVSYVLFLYNLWRAVYSQRAYRDNIYKAREEACNCLAWTLGYGLVALAMIILIYKK